MREKILDILEKNGRIDLKEMAITVSYTHLDVYKRQMLLHMDDLAKMMQQLLLLIIMRMR